MIGAAIKKTQLGYGLICVANKNDLGRGLTMLVQQFNPRPLDSCLLKRISNEKNTNGLWNQQEHESIKIAIDPTLIKGGLVLEKKSSDYTNHIQWSSDLSSSSIFNPAPSVMYLLNGNHRTTWMHTEYALETYQFEHVQAQHAKAEVGSCDRKDAEETMNRLGTHLEQNAVWLAEFFDYSK